MTTELGKLQDRNISAIFNLLDSDRDGKITAEDFDLDARRMCELVGVTVDSDNGRRLLHAYEAWWNQIRHHFDIDEDGHVTMDEFAASYKGARATLRSSLVSSWSE
jgi:Ca2+-binding EF-hand superfamily protein